MPLEPNQNMDELLKTYAKERRDQAGAPLELHPVTRQFLHAQVESLHAKAPAHSQRRGFGWLWPRLAFAGLVVAIGFGLVYWQAGGRHHETTTRYADNKRVAPTPKPSTAFKVQAPSGTIEKSSTSAYGAAVPKAPSAAAAPVASPPGGARRELKMAVEAPKSVAPTSVAENRPETAPERLALADTSAAPKLEGALDRLVQEKDQKLASTSMRMDSDKVVEPPTVATASAAPVVVQPKAMSLNAASVSDVVLPGTNHSATSLSAGVIRFALVDAPVRYRRNLLSPPNPKVLTAFTWENDGRQIRVVDADGSVYTGPTQAVAKKETVTGGESDGSYAFRLTGTNRTLRQVVVFSGTYSPGIAVRGRLGVSGDIGGGGFTTNEAKVSGQVSVGDSEFPLNAVPSR